MARRRLRSFAAEGLEWERVFLVLTAALSSTIVLKVGQVQYLEVLYAFQVVLLFRAFARSRFETSMFRSMLVLAVLYSGFVGFGLLFAGFTLSQDFYIPPGVSTLHLPLIIALLRAAELFLSLAVMFHLVHLFARSAEKLRLAMRVYFWTGVASAAFSLLTLPLAALGFGNYGTYAENFRWRGFFNEGGPYGLYLISVFLVAMALRALRWEPRWLLWPALALTAIAFVGSRSKAAAVALFLLLAVNVLLLQSGKRRLITAGVFVLVVVGLGTAVDLEGALRLYRVGASAYERLSRRHAGDINFVQGRIAGAFIVPRMVTEHPILGVGWGNYGLVRNAPEYRGASAWADIADEPSLGLLGQTSEFGIPLTLLLLVCQFFPVVYLRRLRAPGYVLNLALLQPVVHLFGGQLNLTYPWVVTAIALALGLRAQAAAPALPRLASPPLLSAGTPQPAGAH